MDHRVDFIVVGSGSAGAVVASRLTEDPRCRVLLVEAGPARVPPESIIPAAFSKLFRSAVDWDYRTEPEPGLGGRRLYWPRGRMLGGSSAMNAMIWTPPARADLDGWVALGNPGWGWSDLEPALRRAERPAAGASGIPIAPLRTVSPVTDALVAAARAHGIPPNDGFRDGRMDGAGGFLVTQRRGRRVSAAAGYLDPARGRANLSVVTGARVRQVLVEGRRAVGISYRVDGDTTAREARGPVILAAGAIGSPHLLLLSGIGPARDLERVGVPVVGDLPGVGHNLQDHLAAGIAHHCRRPVSLAGAETLGNLLRYLVLGRGPLTSNVAEAGAFVRIGAGADRPDVEVIFAPTFFVDHGFGNPEGHGFTVAAVLLQPESRGAITLTSADPDQPPRIIASYLAAEADRRRLEAGLELARTIAARPEVSEYRGPAFLPEPGEGLETLIRDRAQTLYHPVGTCRMGPGGEAVVDHRLRVHGVDDLWVADASVMPRITAGHTHAPTVLIGERAAVLVRDHAGT